MDDDHREELTKRLTVEIRRASQEFIMREMPAPGPAFVVADVVSITLDALQRNMDALSQAGAIMASKRRANR